MRITGGELRGRRLHAPRGRSLELRPMQDQVRAALFSALGEVVRGARVLDLFAGTGSVGLEALSRGASFAVFVEASCEAIEALKRNALELGLRDRVAIVQDDVLRALERLWRRGERFDLVFLDPPYEQGLAQRTLERLGQLDALLSEGAVVVASVFKKEARAPRYGGLERVRERTYGDTALVFYCKGGGEGAEKEREG